MSRKALFFDRDGTLIKDKNYICRFDEVEIFPYAAEALNISEKKDFMSIGITNQSSIARGICTEDQVKKIHMDLIEYFSLKGANIHRIYYCPFHEEGKIKKYRKKDSTRKPQPGMILQASEDFNIDLSHSVMVGDSTRDIIAGINAGCRTALVLTGNGKAADKELKKLNIQPDFIAENILEIAKLL